MELDRRSFVGASAGVAGAVAAACCQGAVAGALAAETEGNAPVRTWSDAPEPITDIAETFDYDVVVVGAGAAGGSAALAASQAGAKTAIIQKGAMTISHGRSPFGVASRWHTEAGVEIDLNDITNAHIHYMDHRPQYDFVKRIFTEAGPTCEWLADTLGLEFRFSGANPDTAAVYPWDEVCFETSLSDGLMSIERAALCLEFAQENYGLEVFWNHPGQQLVTDESGHVTGIIALREDDGAYVRFNAAKGVILCTGDYGSDYEMCDDLCPWVLGTNNYYFPNYNTGDGHKMGVWVGAKMETRPHTKMAHIHNCIDGTNLNDAPIKVDPFLWVNAIGSRFTNEQTEYCQICNAVREQPGDVDVFYLVFDADYAEQRANFLNASAQRPVTDEKVQAAIDLDYMVKADTLEECAEHYGIPWENLKATVERYNELVAAGHDEDFGKPAADLAPIEKAPFYIVRSYPSMDVTLGGLMTDLDMQVLNEAGEVIGGLYACGNTSGGFFGGSDYDLEVNSTSIGRALTTGRLAGQHAAAK